MKLIALKSVQLSLILFLITTGSYIALAQSQGDNPTVRKISDNRLNEYVQKVNAQCRIYYEGKNIMCDFSNLGSYLESAPPNLCKYIRFEMQDECFYTHAKFADPIAVCEYADDVEIRNKCFYSGANIFLSENASICEEITDLELRRYCRSRAAYRQIFDLKSSQAILSTISMIGVLLIMIYFVFIATRKAVDLETSKISYWFAPAITSIVHLIIARILYPILVFDPEWQFVYGGLRFFDMIHFFNYMLRGYFISDWIYRVLIDLAIIVFIFAIMRFVILRKSTWTWRIMFIFLALNLAFSGGYIALSFWRAASAG